MSNKIDTLNIFICPSCSSKNLKFQERKIHCESCKKTFMKNNNIYYFDNNKASFNWNVKGNPINSFLKNIKKSDLNDAFNNTVNGLTIDDGVLLWARTYDPTRSTLQYILNIKKNDKVLEIGPGWGAIALHIIPNCSEYFALDQIRDHVHYISETLKRDKKNYNKLKFICSGNDNFIPFKSNKFDHVILNGVLEWVASNNLSSSPKKIQELFLNEINRILKPNGKLYIGIENRISWKYFRGTPEGHIKMMFGALLPRFVTRLYLKIFRNQNFREYTYTLWGYYELLKLSKFKFKRFFTTIPQYSNIKYFSPISLFSNFRSLPLISNKPWNKKNIFSTFPFNLFSPNYGFIASRSNENLNTIIDEIINILILKNKWNNVKILNGYGCISGTGKINSLILVNKKNKYWLSIAGSNFTRRGIKQNYLAYNYLKNKKNIKDSIINLYEINNYENYTYSLEDYFDGKSPILNFKNDYFNKYNLKVYDKIIEISKLGRSKIIDKKIYSNLISIPFDNLKKWFTPSENLKYKKLLDNISKWLYSSFFNKKLLLVPIHGDLVPTNTLVNSKNEIKIIDWEFFQEEGLPLTDLIIFIGNSYRIFVREEFLNKNIDPDKIAFHGYPEMFLNSEFSVWLNNYLNEMKIDMSLKKPLLFMWWISYVNNMLPFYQFNPKWKIYRVEDILNKWDRILNFEIKK